MTVADKNQVSLVAHLVPRSGQERALALAITSLVPAVLEERGCIAYVAHESRERLGTIVMYEVWEDDAALADHAAGPNFTDFARNLDVLLAEPLKIETLRRIS
jgi:quinol monooxygenase YgiN